MSDFVLSVTRRGCLGPSGQPDAVFYITKDRGYDLLASKDEKNVAMGTPGRMTKDQVTSKKKE